MADDRAPWEPESAGRSCNPTEDLDELRELILGSERRKLGELERRLADTRITQEELARLLPEAISLRTSQGTDRQLARALAPTMERAIGESVRRNPREFATAIFPVLGPAIRKAIAEALASLVSSINGTIEHSLSPRGLKWRLESWRTGIPFAQIVLKHALVYRVEQVFLIHTETGLLLSHAWLPDVNADNADLISGMLSAIRDFVGDSFEAEKSTGGFKRASIGELILVVEQGPRAMIAAVVRGQPPEGLLSRLQDALEAIHLRFSGELADFDGDAAPFRAAHPLLEECLATVVETDRRRDGRRVNWIPWAVAALLLAGFFTWRGVRAEQLWTSAMDRLRSEPGLVITRAERDGKQWNIAGLRDPLAPNPSALLATLAVDTSTVQQRWEPYFSLQPELLLARARSMLTVPPTAEVQLAGDTLRLSGSAPLDWAAGVMRRPSLPAGIGALDLGGITMVLPPALLTLGQEIEANRVLFAAGSSVPGPEARATVALSAESFRRLSDEAAALGGRVVLELIGRADATGTDEGNQALSQNRVEAVLALLERQGVPASDVTLKPVGTGLPLQAADSAALAQINRSVSFTVRLDQGATGAESRQ